MQIMVPFLSESIMTLKYTVKTIFTLHAATSTRSRNSVGFMVQPVRTEEQNDNMNSITRENTSLL